MIEVCRHFEIGIGMSAFGTKRRFRIARPLVAVGIEADILEVSKCRESKADILTDRN